mgnify:CR=1 FL=1
MLAVGSDAASSLRSSASTCCLLDLMLLQLLQPCISSAPTVYLARLTADQLLEPDPQCARRLAYRLFRIFPRRVLRIRAIPDMLRGMQEQHDKHQQHSKLSRKHSKPHMLSKPSSISLHSKPSMRQHSLM